MLNAEKQFSESELLEIETVVVQAEEKTSAEIVVAVASESGRYDRGECHFGIVVAVLALVFFNLLNYVLDEGKHSIFDTGIPFYGQIAIVVSGYVGGMIVASLNTKLRMLLCTADEVEEEVSKGARLVFLEEVLSSHRLGGAVLIYLSLAECRVAVMVDDRIKSAVGKDCTDLVNGVQQRVVRLTQEGSVVRALCAGAELAGNRLKAQVPYVDGDINELPNHVVLVHPRP